MTNRIAIVLGTILVVLIVIDTLLFGTEHVVFAGKRLLELIDWLAFWR